MNSKNKGFSLLEVIVVVSMIAVLIIVQAPFYVKYIGKAKQTKCLVNADTFRQCYEVATADLLALKNHAPATADTFTIVNGILVPNESGNPENARYNEELKKILDTIFTDDYTNIDRIHVQYSASGTADELFICFNEGGQKYDYSYNSVEKDLLLSDGAFQK